MNMFSIAGRGHDALILQELQQLRRWQVQSILRVIDPYEKMSQTSAHRVRRIYRLAVSSLDTVWKEI